MVLLIIAIVSILMSRAGMGQSGVNKHEPTEEMKRNRYH